jgi:hypothetical protein
MTSDHSHTRAASVEALDEATDQTGRELERHGIISHQHTSYEWNGYRYSNASDAIAAASRAARSTAK